MNRVCSTHVCPISEQHLITVLASQSQCTVSIKSMTVHTKQSKDNCA